MTLVVFFRFVLALGIGALSFSLACHRTQRLKSPVSDQAGPEIGGNQDSTLRAVARIGRTYPTTTRAIAGRFGPPLDSVKHVEENKYSKLMDTLVILKYRGIEFVVLRISEGHREILAAVTVRDAATRLRPTLGVGSSLGRVVTLLGPGKKQALGDTTLVGYTVYPEPGDAPTQVNFWVVAGTVRKFQWAFYVD